VFDALERKLTLELTFLARQVLCELGLEPNLPDAQGLTAMHWAADVGQVEVLHALYQLGADPSARDQLGQGPLHAAAKKGQLEALRVLKELGCDVHQVRSLAPDMDFEIVVCISHESTSLKKVS